MSWTTTKTFPNGPCHVFDDGSTMACIKGCPFCSAAGTNKTLKDAWRIWFEVGEMTTEERVKKVEAWARCNAPSIDRIDAYLEADRFLYGSRSNAWLH